MPELEIYDLAGELLSNEPNDIIMDDDMPIFERSARFEMVRIGLSEVLDGEKIQ